jgi:LmbE family N-acetylglucosaminyl deacetylase
MTLLDRPRDQDRIQAPGTPEERWSSWPAPSRWEPLPLDHIRSAVIVAAHPDDDVLGLGGTIAQLAAAGARLRVVFATDGEASHPNSTAMQPARLAAIRRDEAHAALAALGAEDAEIVRLQLPDSAVGSHTEQLVRMLRTLTIGFDVCAAPWSGDAHADHEATGRAARAAARRAGTLLWQYPVWMWHWAMPGDRRVPWHRAGRIEVPGWALERKQAAITRHASQIHPLGPGPGDAAVLPPDELEHFDRGFETVLR